MGDAVEVISEIVGEQIRVAFTERHDFQPDQEICFSPVLEAVHLFDATSGRPLTT